jgi:uncharacterized protein YbjT (DUF2867 family)
LRDTGHEVRALIRATANQNNVAELKKLGTETIEGDLKKPKSLLSACKGAETVISTASSTLSRQEGDSISSVDLRGQLDLISAARTSGVEHFIYVSFHRMSPAFPLQDAKRTVERELRESGMTYTILQPTFFMEVWLGPALGFDPVNAKARLYGSGEHAVPWISLEDVARFVVASVENPAARNQTIELGGPEHLTPLEVVKRFEHLAGRSFDVELVPETLLHEQYDAADNALDRSFAGLMLAYHDGFSVDMKPILERMPIKQTQLSDYATRILPVRPMEIL